MPLETEAWGVDVVVVGSQKALALPPGPRLPVGEREGLGAHRVREVAALLLRPAARAQGARRDGESAFTPAISHVVALEAALERVAAMGGVDALVENAGHAGGHDARGGRAPSACRSWRRETTATP